MSKDAALRKAMFRSFAALDGPPRPRTTVVPLPARPPRRPKPSVLAHKIRKALRPES